MKQVLFKITAGIFLFNFICSPFVFSKENSKVQNTEMISKMAMVHDEPMNHASLSCCEGHKINDGVFQIFEEIKKIVYLPEVESTSGTLEKIDYTKIKLKSGVPPPYLKYRPSVLLLT